VLAALLPLLPTTPFMLLALWSFSRSSQRFHHWLYNHRIFGPRLREWSMYRTVPWPIKLSAYGSMVASLAYLAFLAQAHWAIVSTAAAVMLVGVCVIGHFPSKRHDTGDVLSNRSASPGP